MGESRMRATKVIPPSSTAESKALNKVLLLIQECSKSKSRWRLIMKQHKPESSAPQREQKKATTMPTAAKNKTKIEKIKVVAQEELNLLPCGPNGAGIGSAVFRVYVHPSASGVRTPQTPRRSCSRHFCISLFQLSPTFRTFWLRICFNVSVFFIKLSFNCFLLAFLSHISLFPPAFHPHLQVSPYIREKMKPAAKCCAANRAQTPNPKP